MARPLLTIDRTLEDNGYCRRSLTLADALLRAGKPYELLPLAGATHMVPDPEIIRGIYTRIMDFFETNLKP